MWMSLCLYIAYLLLGSYWIWSAIQSFKDGIYIVGNLKGEKI